MMTHSQSLTPDQISAAWEIAVAIIEMGESPWEIGDYVPFTKQDNTRRRYYNGASRDVWEEREKCTPEVMTKANELVAAFPEGWD